MPYLTLHPILPYLRSSLAVCLTVPYEPYLLPYLTLPYHTIPYILPYLTLPYVLPYLTFYLTLPYLTMSYLTLHKIR